MNGKIATTIHAEVDQINFTLPDGRVVTVFSHGDVSVRLSETDSNRYQFTLPSFDEVAAGCDETDDNQIPFYVHHRH